MALWFTKISSPKISVITGMKKAGLARYEGDEYLVLYLFEEMPWSRVLVWSLGQRQC